jgi:hypothetical protein
MRVQARGGGDRAMFRVRPRPVFRALFIALLFGTTLAITACSANGALPSPMATSSASAGPSGPALQPDGTAQDNKAFFDSVNEALLVENAKPDGRGFIDSLIAAGFAKKDMEVTPDKTAIGLDRDNIQFSVKFDTECLIGQFGNVGYHSTIAPVTQTDKCLVGITRAIDW